MSVILIDVDDTIVDLAKNILRKINKKTGKSYKRDSVIDNWDYLSGLDEKDRKLADTIMIRRGFTKKLSLIKGVKEKIEKLRNKDHKLVALTSPFIDSPTWCYDRYQFLFSLGFKKKDIYFTSGKFRVQGDDYIDDSPDQLKEWKAWNPSGNAYMITYPNTINLVPKNVIPIKSFNEFADIILKRN